MIFFEEKLLDQTAEQMAEDIVVNNYHSETKKPGQYCDVVDAFPAESHVANFVVGLRLAGDEVFCFKKQHGRNLTVYANY